MNNRLFLVSLAALVVFSSFLSFGQVHAQIVPEGTVMQPVIKAIPGLTPSDMMVSITAPTVGSVIRYTLDGTGPTTSSALYTAPFHLVRTAAVNARAYKEGMTESSVAGGAFFVGSSKLTKTLVFGMRDNEEVKILQRVLLSESVYNGPITGNFLSLTLAGVKAFQEKYSIAPVSGMVGPLTRAQVNSLL